MMVDVGQTEMAKTMERQPADLRRLLDDRVPVESAAKRIAGRRVFVVGTGTSWHAANQGAWLLRLAGVDAMAVAAADCALWGPRPTTADALVLLSHRGTKRYTSEVLTRARADGVPAVAIGGADAPGADIETVEQETAGTFTASHLGALARLAQLAVALGANLGDLGAVPDAVAAALAAPSPGVELPERGLEFVGAGPNQWTAAEGALKVREAAHLFTEGLSVEQLRHGPGFALGPRDALVSLDGGGAERGSAPGGRRCGRGGRVARLPHRRDRVGRAAVDLFAHGRGATNRARLRAATRDGSRRCRRHRVALVRPLAALVEPHGR
jgi:glucosamine--fructose-6-phosphate aminotransferase (isomerizing)